MRIVVNKHLRDYLVFGQAGSLNSQITAYARGSE